MLRVRLLDHGDEAHPVLDMEALALSDPAVWEAIVERINALDVSTLFVTRDDPTHVTATERIAISQWIDRDGDKFCFWRIVCVDQLTIRSAEDVLRQHGVSFNISGLPGDHRPARAGSTELPPKVLLLLSRI